jgi:predicted dinucleotide-binding enzyme
MKIGVLGTGMVGHTIGSRLIMLSNEVMMGSRTATNPKARDWVRTHRTGASQGSFAEAAAFGDIIFNCTKGEITLDVLQQAGAANLDGKILIDVSNPLDFSKGMPPTLIPALCNTTSLGEEIQKAYPNTKVVKALNTVSSQLMVNPSTLPGQHDLFICGNDAEAKNTVTDILKEWFGWRHVHDLGDISNARGTEMLLPVWVRLFGHLGTPNFNFHIVKGQV